MDDKVKTYSPATTLPEASVALRLRERYGRISGLAYLQRAKRRLEDELCWVQGAESTDRKGIPCGGVKAVRFSIWGALQHEKTAGTPIEGPGYGPGELAAAEAALCRVTGGNPQRWNDRWWRSHKGVLRALDKAMEIELRK